MAQDPKVNEDATWDENCIKAGGIPYDGDDYRKYKPNGKFEDIDTGAGKDKYDKLSFYTSDPKDIKDMKGVIIFIYDIFGWNKTTKNNFEFADMLVAQTNCRVIMPDFYRGEPWALDKFPPGEEDKAAFGQWWGTVASHDIVVKDVYEKILKLKSVQGLNVGCIGFCWGGLQTIQLGADSKTFKCMATLHAAGINPEIIEKLAVPLYYAPADGDFAVEKAEEVLKAKNDKLCEKCVFHHFKGQVHGWSAARGDFTKQEILKDLETALAELKEFFGKHMA